MKILLDECVTKRLAGLLAGHEVATVPRMKWSGLRNGPLMAKAVESGFDALLTIDKNLRYQQSIGKHNLTLVIFDTPSSKIEVLKDYVPDFLKMLPTMKKGSFYVIER